MVVQGSGIDAHFHARGVSADMDGVTAFGDAIRRSEIVDDFVDGSPIVRRGSCGGSKRVVGMRRRIDFDLLADGNVVRIIGTGRSLGRRGRDASVEAPSGIH